MSDILGMSQFAGSNNFVQGGGVIPLHPDGGSPGQELPLHQGRVAELFTEQTPTPSLNQTLATTTSSDGPTTVDELVVIAHRDGVEMKHWNGNSGDDDKGGKGGGGGGGDRPPPDEKRIDVTVNFDRALTPEETAALLDFKAALAANTAFIKGLAASDHVVLANGVTLTGAELKALWAKTDYAINEVGHVYSNSTQRGEANYNDGNPKVSFNIDIVVSYDKWGPPGVQFLGFHELGHISQAGRNSNLNIDANHDGSVSEPERLANERLANDTAAAILNHGGIVLNPGFVVDGGFSGPPAVFVP